MTVWLLTLCRVPDFRPVTRIWCRRRHRSEITDNDTAYGLQIEMRGPRRKRDHMKFPERLPFQVHFRRTAVRLGRYSRGDDRDLARRAFTGPKSLTIASGSDFASTTLQVQRDGIVGSTGSRSDRLRLPTVLFLQVAIWQDQFGPGVRCGFHRTRMRALESIALQNRRFRIVRDGLLPASRQ